MLKRVLPFFLLALFSSHSHAAGLDISLGSETAQITFLTQSATFGYGGADIGIGLFANEDDDVFVTGSILVSGSGTGDVRALQFGVGGKLYGGRIDMPAPTDSLYGGALAIGGQLRYVFPASTPFAVLAEVFWAPSVTSFSDFDRLLDARVALELEVTPSARAYVDYRLFQVELDPNSQDYDVDDGAHIGVRFAF
jgi:hypothetical protein